MKLGTGGQFKFNWAAITKAFVQEVGLRLVALSEDRKSATRRSNAASILGQSPKKKKKEFDLVFYL